MRRWLAMATACLVVVIAGAVPAAAVGPGRWPVAGPVVRRFDPPDAPWGAGHRGVDVGTVPGAVVAAPADGVISFVGRVAGRGVVVVDHGGLRSTLEPVDAGVTLGQRVRVGQALGTLAPGHPCAAAACLHWGVKRGEEYLDPTILLGGQVRLLPADAVARARARAELRVLKETMEGLEDAVGGAGVSTAGGAAGSSGLGSSPAGAGRLARPVAAAVTSVFGRRFHPIFHEWRLHAGVDLSARCGTPIRAAADGVVAHMGFDSSGGWRLVVDHGGGFTTSYLHAQAYSVAQGQRVRRGKVVGRVGTTGWSTGCHLHFGVKKGGRAVDPQRFW